MSSGLILFMITGWSVMATYHCFRYQNAYWIYPTITGFGDRKKPCDPKSVYLSLGIYTGIWTSVVAGYTIYYFWQIIAGK